MTKKERKGECKKTPPHPLRSGGVSIEGTLSRGGVAIIATDTLYGIVARALDKKAVARVYRIKKRAPKKPLIILLPRAADAALFGVRVSVSTARILRAVWPGPVSVVFPCRGKRFAYLHRGTFSLAFRVPRSAKLRKLLRKTGPLVAPSANPEGLPPADSIAAAKKYFGGRVDAYENTRKNSHSFPSALVSFVGVRPQLLREGDARAAARVRRMIYLKQDAKPKS